MMEPPALSVNELESLAVVARLLKEPIKDRSLTMSREYREAAAHRQRDQGSMAFYLDTSHNVNYVSPRACVRRPSPAVAGEPVDRGTTAPQPRLHGSAGLENLRRSRNAEVAKLLSTLDSENASEMLDQPRPRVVSHEAEENLVKQRAGTMKDLLNLEMNKTQIQAKLPPGHNLTKEAAENHNKHTESSIAALLTQSKPGALPSEPSIHGSEQRKKARAPDTCAAVLRGELAGDPLPEARVKYSGREIYEKHRGTLTSLIAEYGRTSPDLERQHMRRCDDRGMDGSMKTLLEGYGRPMPHSKPLCRVRKPEARRFAKTCSGSSMVQYFSDQKSYKANIYHKWPNY